MLQLQLPQGTLL